jgi:hypothetical protein
MSSSNGRRFISFLLALSLVGCTSLKPVNMTASELQKQIPTGSVINANDEIKLETSDGKTRQFVVTEVTNTHVRGVNNSIPINTISSVKKVKTNMGKTAGLTAVVLATVAVAFAYSIVKSTVDEIDN